jgi:hypothetical protein
MTSADPTNLHDPGLHLFVDDAELQDHPGFVRKVQRPTRVQPEPVLRPETPWEGKTVQIKGGYRYNSKSDLFEMWYWTWSCTIDEMNEGAPTFLCYATSKDGIDWERPKLGEYEFEGSRKNNIVLATRGDPWGIIVDPLEQDQARRFKLGLYYTPPGSPGSKDREARRRYMESVVDRDGMYACYSPDGIHWNFEDRRLIGRAGDSGALVYDPMQGRYIASSRRASSIADHFVLEWKGYRRVIALSESKDFASWTPLQTVLKPDEFDDVGVQLYQMVPFVYGNQYIAFLWVAHPTELSGMELASARELYSWDRVGRREEFFSVGSPGSWDMGWAALGLSPPALKGDILHMWYSGKPQGHGTQGNFNSSIGLLTLRRDGFVALRAGTRGGEFMTESIKVTGPKLSVNATVLFGELRVRVIDDVEVPEGYSMEECNGLVRDDSVDAPITWGSEHRDLTPFVGRKIRLHVQTDNATSLFSYRTW